MEQLDFLIETHTWMKGIKKNRPSILVNPIGKYRVLGVETFYARRDGPRHLGLRIREHEDHAVPAPAFWRR